MKVHFVFVPPGGGEADYSLQFELPGLPQPGDYISIARPGDEGTSDFIVRRMWWHLAYPNNDLYSPSDTPVVYGSVQSLVVECEFAKGPSSNPAHLRSVEMYQNRKGVLLQFESTAY